MNRVKYIIASDGSAVVFSAAISHDTFKHLNPTSAGFVNFFVNDEGKIDCTCFGDSYSLGIGSQESDTLDIRLQILGRFLI